jgi:hypothetical protein
VPDEAHPTITLGCGLESFDHRRHTRRVAAHGGEG